MPEWRITKLRGQYALTWDEPSGTRRRYSLGTADAKEAARLAPARYALLTRPRGSTVEELWQGYMTEMEGRAIKTTLGFTWRALKPRFGGMEAEEIRLADCRAHVAERRKAGIKDGTIHTELGHLRMALRWAEKNEFIARAPNIERPAKPEAKGGYLTRAEAAKMLEAVNAPHVGLAIMLMIGTGARVTAALELTWDRVNFQTRMIHLRNPFDKTRRKERATVPMNDTLLAALQTAKAGALTPYVIEWGGKPVKSLKRGIKTAARAIGRDDVAPHIFRHSAAVWLVEDGHSMDEVSQFLGHSDSRITAKVYARYSPGYLRKLASSLDMKFPLAQRT